MMNLAGVPPELRKWAIQESNKIDRIGMEVDSLRNRANAAVTNIQRPVAAAEQGRINVSGPTTPSSEISNFYYVPVDNGPLVQFYTTSGLVKISYSATIIIRMTTSNPTENVFGVSYQIIDDVGEQGDFSGIEGGTLEGWSLQDIRISSHVVNREYRFNVSAIQYANTQPGAHYCRLNYAILSIGGSSVLSFANRTLVVEPI